MSPEHEQIQARLLEIREQIVKRVLHIENDIQGLKNLDSQEQAQERENDEVLDRLDEAGRDELRNIDAALRRLSAGEYGVCESCGGPIGEARLEALPYALKCVRCASRK